MTEKPSRQQRQGIASARWGDALQSTSLCCANHPTARPGQKCPSWPVPKGKQGGDTALRTPALGDPSCAGLHPQRCCWVIRWEAPV